MKKRLMAVLLLFAAALVLAGCTKEPDYSKGNNVRFVRSVVNAMNKGYDPVEEFYTERTDFEEEQSFTPYMTIYNMKLSAVNDDATEISYSCKIMGVEGVVFNMLMNRMYILNDKYCEKVEMSGTLRIVEVDGQRKIDVTKEDNPFYLYLSLSHMNKAYTQMFGADVDNLTADNFNNAWSTILTLGIEEYATVLGKDFGEYFDEISGNIGNYINNLPTISAGETVKVDSKTGKTSTNVKFSLTGSSGNSKLSERVNSWSAVKWLKARPGIAALLFLGVPLALGLLWIFGWDIYDSISTRIRNKRFLNSDGIWQKEIENVIATGEGNSASAISKYCGYSYDKFSKMIINGEVPRDSSLSYDDDPGLSLEIWDKKRLTAAICLARSPKYDDVTMRMLCRNIHEATYRPSETVITMAGWSAAALGRSICQNFEPSDIPENREALKKASEAAQEDSKKLRELEAKIKLLEEQEEKRSGAGASADGYRDSRNEQESIREEIGELRRKLSGGLGCYMLDEGADPFMYLFSILNDSVHSAAPFVRQGIIMGLIDWLSENSKDPEAGEMLKSLAAARAQMIKTDSQLALFEVRVRENCTVDEYVGILKDVLHCSNPSIKYADMRTMMNTACKEIPDVMELLCACPLRLIDPVNRTTLGFYRFEPFERNAWVRYVPPKETGEVIDRYHEIRDMTVPMSSGLNLSLFTDPYAVIPTLFHENEHYCGDYNEASVFLKTQVFSRRFYKKHPDTAKKDGVFVQLTSLLGEKPAIGKLAEFNALIERYYGRQMPEDEALKAAERVIGGINTWVDNVNRAETWCPDKKFPKLTEKEDADNMQLLREILVRYATVPKSITAEEFKSIAG